MELKAKASYNFKNGCNCCQSVLLPFSVDFGISEMAAKNIAAGFGGGMASQGKTCGAVTGSYMTLGLFHGTKSSDGATVKAQTKSSILEFNRLFKKEFGSLNCKTLLGYNLSKPEESEKAAQLGLFETKCTLFVERATEITASIMSK